MRILIADAQEIEREGHTRDGRARDRLGVCGMAENGPAAVARATELKPDAIVLDLKIPGLDGLEAVRRIKRAVPKTEIPGAQRARV